MNVLLIARTDWANCGYELSQSLCSVGVDALCIAKNSHPAFRFNPGPHLFKSQKEITDLANKADIIVLLHSANTITGVEQDYHKKGIVVFHGGSAYRKRPKGVNRFFRTQVVADLALIQTVDLLGLEGADVEKEVWFLPPIDTGKLKPKFDRIIPGKRVIAHYPSSLQKGTDLFNELMAKLGKDPELKGLFEYRTGTKVHYEQNLKRVPECDIYFESFRPKIGAMLHGEWGLAALEAAAFGKVLVTNFLSHKKYEREYGSHTVQVVNDLETLEAHIKRLILMPNAEFSQLQRDTRDWVVGMHGHEAVGNRLVKIFNERLNWEGK